MAPQQAPSIVSNDSSQRRASKVSYRRQRSQSPTEKSSTQYRSRNIADANVFVDQTPEPPLDVMELLMHIFGVSVLEDIGRASYDHSTSRSLVIQNKTDELAEKYCSKSRQMAKDCAGEGEWKSHLLTGLMEPISELLSETLKLSASVAWIPELRPSPPSIEEILGSEPPLSNSTGPITSAAAFQMPTPLTAPTFPQTPILSTSSIAPTDTTNDDPNRISVPKPDITVGLAYTSFDRLQRKILWDLQGNSRVLSEPHQSRIGLHFPFLILEAKGLATGSNMVGAQNQAAVGGACALGILRDLQLTAQGCITCATDDQPRLRQMMFSVVTEGPIHEMWVHYGIEEEFHMTVLRIWRTTFSKDAREFVQALGKILEWGSCEFKGSVLKALDVYGQALRKRRVE
ncbi:hypothetical protein EJ04DRAFT_467030 [Polyplosphaeria fusca]|uniref:DUF7924 domain-containing protein n=1 Tax=Polyplosphaeria fusca TaxID=682080 RepID=A0A9P4V2I3_9PLEO|nr:hypothetical protein EJ04DRAFT_467030 [Polyplosphaeria fusca]